MPDAEQKNTDVEKQEPAPAAEKTEGKKDENDDELEKVKEKRHPGVNASLVAFYVVFLSMFIIGWINLKSCPTNVMIPIYLIVAGAIGPFAKLLSQLDSRIAYNGALLVLAFGFVWLVLGSYWVYKEYQPNYDASSEGSYCNRTAYLLAFWVITFQHTLLILFVILSGCYMLMRNEFKK